MAQVLVVDDEEDIVWAVGHALRDDGHSVRMAYDGGAALAMTRHQPPDLIILDVTMPHMDGFSFCRQVRTDPGLAALPVLFLTGRNTIDERVRGFDEGADDYMLKPFDLRELKARVRALLRRTQRSAPVPVPTTLCLGDLLLDLNSCQVTIAKQTRQLTPAEFELLRFLMEHPNEICSSDRLLREVWGYTPDSAEPGLVRWHVMNLRGKVEPDPAHPTHVCTVPRHGYILRTQEE